VAISNHMGISMKTAHTHTQPSARVFVRYTVQFNRVSIPYLAVQRHGGLHHAIAGLLDLGAEALEVSSQNSPVDALEVAPGVCACV
jgi:hypothetical protein